MSSNLKWLKTMLAVKDVKTPKQTIKAQVVVGTPGKLWDFAGKQGVLKLNKCKVLICLPFFGRFCLLLAISCLAGAVVCLLWTTHSCWLGAVPPMGCLPASE
jgi:hypothetical protein